MIIFGIVNLHFVKNNTKNVTIKISTVEIDKKGEPSIPKSPNTLNTDLPEFKKKTPSTIPIAINSLLCFFAHLKAFLM